MPDQRKVCPECASARIQVKSPKNGTANRNHAGRYRCVTCLAHFDDPDTRAVEREGPKSGMAARLAAIGERRDDADGGEA